MRQKNNLVWIILATGILQALTSHKFPHFRKSNRYLPAYRFRPKRRHLRPKAAIAHVQTVKTNDQSSTTHSVSITTTAGNLLVAGIVFGNDNTNTATIAGGGTWTLLSGPDNQTVAGNQFRGYMWYSASATGGASTVTVTVATAAWACFQVMEISGAAASPADQVAVAASTVANTTPTSPNVTTTQADEILIGFGGNMANQADGITAGTGYTLPVNGNNDSPANGQWSGMEYRVVAATGSYNATFTIVTAGHWLMYIATFKAAGAAAIQVDSETFSYLAYEQQAIRFYELEPSGFAPLPTALPSLGTSDEAEVQALARWQERFHELEPSGFAPLPAALPTLGTSDEAEVQALFQKWERIQEEEPSGFSPLPPVLPALGTSEEGEQQRHAGIYFPFEPPGEPAYLILVPALPSLGTTDEAELQMIRPEEIHYYANVETEQWPFVLPPVVIARSTWLKAGPRLFGVNS